MRNLKQFLLVLCMLAVLALSPAQASAIGLEYYGVEMTINEDRSVDHNVVMEFDSGVNSLDYNLDFTIEDFSYEYDFEFADCSSSDSGPGSTISCTFIGMTNESSKLTFDFRTLDAIKKDGDNYRYTVNYGIPLEIQSSFILIRLPQNNILAGEEGRSFFPDTGQTLTDGKRIMVFWESEQLETGEDLQFSILFTRPLVSDFTGVFIYLIAIVAILFIFFGFIFFRRMRGSKVAVVKSVLNRDEKRLIDILNSRGGKAGQKLLVRESDFSKAKVSRIVKGLKERGVLGTEPISGRENRVFLRLGEKQEPQ